MPKVKTSRLSKLNVFANSSLVIKLFGPVVILLMLLAVSYGGYLLFKENFGDAASKKGHYKFNSKNIKHQAGFRENGKVAGLPKGDAWFANASFIPDRFNKKKDQFGLPINLRDIAASRNKYVWYGPYASLKTGQYLGCFYYSFVDPLPNIAIKTGSAELDVYNGGKVYNKLSIHENNKLGRSNKGKYSRTCLAFYVNKKDAKKVELRIKLLDGYMVIRGTSITKLSDSDNNLSNIRLLKSPDNSSVLQGYDYKLDTSF